MRLRAAGVLIELDDFGVGHSNLSALREFPVDIIKIDRDFIAQLKKTGFDEPFIDSIVSLARQLKIQVIAEGIETKLEAEILTQKGVPMLQGYYFSQPVPIEKLKAFLKITAAT